MKLPEGDYETVAGFVISCLERVPDEGDVVEVRGARLEVTTMDGPRVVELVVVANEVEGGVGLSDVAKAHMADLQTQSKYDVEYLRYWVDETQGKIFCLVEAPSADAAATVHREAHGLVADAIYQVQEGS